MSVAALGVHDGDDVVVVSKGGQLVRVKASGISQIGRGTQGVRVVSLNDGDKVISAARIDESIAGESSPEDLPPAPGEPA